MLRIRSSRRCRPLVRSEPLEAGVRVRLRLTDGAGRAVAFGTVREGVGRARVREGEATVGLRLRVLVRVRVVVREGVGRGVGVVVRVRVAVLRRSGTAVGALDASRRALEPVERITRPGLRFSVVIERERVEPPTVPEGVFEEGLGTGRITRGVVVVVRRTVVLVRRVGDGTLDARSLDDACGLIRSPIFGLRTVVVRR